jgi:hypothetical protein
MVVNRILCPQFFSIEDQCTLLKYDHDLLIFCALGAYQSMKYTVQADESSPVNASCFILLSN